MKYLFLIALGCWIHPAIAQLNINESTIETKLKHSLSYLASDDDSLSQVVQTQFPSILKYQAFPNSTGSFETIERTTMIGLNFENNSAEKTVYARLAQEGWKIKGADYSLGVFGKVYRKNKEKKASRYQELRIYKTNTSKLSTPLNFIEINFEKSVFPEQIELIHSTKDSVQPIGFGFVFSEKNNPLTRHLVLADLNLNKIGQYSYNIEEKTNVLSGFLKIGNEYQCLSYSNSGLLKKNNPSYTIFTMKDEKLYSASLDMNDWERAGSNYYPGALNRIVQPSIDYVQLLDNGEILRIGHLDVTVPDATVFDQNNTFHQDIFVWKTDAAGNTTSLQFYNNPDEVETEIAFYKETQEHYVIGLRNVAVKDGNTLLIIDKLEGSIQSHSITPTTLDYFWTLTDAPNSVEFFGTSKHEKGKLFKHQMIQF